MNDTHILLLIVLIITLIYIYVHSNKKNKENFISLKYNNYNNYYDKFNYNIKDVKKLPTNFHQNSYHKSDIIDLDVSRGGGGVKKTCLKKCKNNDKCAGVYVWKNDNNNLSTCNMIMCNKQPCNSKILSDFYKKLF